MMIIKYSAWLSTRGEKRAIRDGAKFAGFVRDLPAKFKSLVDDSEVRQFCIVYEGQGHE